MKKQRGRKRRLLLLLILLLLIGGAVVLLSNGDADIISTVQNILNNNGGGNANQPPFGNRSTSPASINGSVLTWVGDAVQPGQQTASQPGQLVLMLADGTTEVVFDVPPQTGRIVPCGDAALSPDRHLFAFYMGLDEGQLYLMRDGDQFTVVDDSLHAMSCVGNGTFQFSPNSQLFAYLGYPGNVGEALSPTGRLEILNATDYQTVTSYENVTAFDLDNNRVAFVQFFKNDQNQADEAAIMFWDGQVDQEVVTLMPGESCYYSSANVQQITDQRWVVLMGHRCPANDLRNEWQLYVVDTVSRTATLSLSDVHPGQYLPYARTNTLYVSPQEGHTFFTVPDALTNHTVAIAHANLTDTTTSIITENETIMPRLRVNPYATENHLPVLSPDGRWLAVTRNTANNEATLIIIDLENPTLPPISINAGSVGDTITEVLFALDRQEALYIAGGNEGRDNALFSVNLLTGSNTRLHRGRFGSGVLAPDSSAVVLMNWQIVDDPDQPPYLSLIRFDLETQNETILFEGADIIDGEVTNPRFAFPLVWAAVSG